MGSGSARPTAIHRSIYFLPRPVNFPTRKPIRKPNAIINTMRKIWVVMTLQKRKRKFTYWAF